MKLLVIILITIVVRDCSLASFADLETILGLESHDGYFSRFDLTFRGFHDEDVSSYLTTNMETSHLPHLNLSDVEKQENNALLILINLKDLDSLAQTLKAIGESINKLECIMLRWEGVMSDVDEAAIKSTKEYAKGFEIDSDIYLIYMKCLPNDLEILNSTEFEKEECDSGMSQLKMLEFYSIKNELFIENVNLNDPQMQLEQKVIRRTDFRRSPLSTVAAYGYPFRAQFNERNDSFVSGYEAEQIHFLGDSYNLSILVGVGNGWITDNGNNTLGGMGAQVIKGDADISISASEVLPYRAKHLTFLHPTYYTKMWGFFVQPPSSSFRDIFLHAFASDLWFTMFSTWILIIMAMGALSLVKRRLDTMHEHDTILIQELFIWGVGAICQQGWHVCPESTCFKIIFIFGLITGLVSYVAYSAALVSILSVKVVPVRNLDDIVNRGYTIYQDNQTINAQYVIQKLESEGRIPCLSVEQRSIRSEAALPKILLSNSAFIGAADFFYPTARDNMNDTAICNSISKLSISARPIRGGMFIRKSSPLKDFFNHKLMIMYERGIRFRLLETYFKESSVMCLEKTGATKDPLGFNDVYSAFVILLLGYFISFIILIIERLYPPAHYETAQESICSKALLLYSNSKTQTSQLQSLKPYQKF